MPGTTSAHNLGPACRLAPVVYPDKNDGVPPIEAQFFYSSSIPIDDPLSATGIANPSDARSGKIPLRPFGSGDNAALERAWLELHSEADRKTHGDLKNSRQLSSEMAQTSSEKRKLFVHSQALKHWGKHRSSSYSHNIKSDPDRSFSGALETACCPDLVTDVSEELQANTCALERTVNPDFDIERMVQDITGMLARFREVAKVKEGGNLQTTTEGDGSLPSTPRNNTFRMGGRSDISQNKSQFGAVRGSENRTRSSSSTSNRSLKGQASIPIPRPSVVNDGISGQPFVRVGSVGTPISTSFPRTASPAPQTVSGQDVDQTDTLEDPEVEAQKVADALKEKKYYRDSAEVAVGVSRLHMVKLPALNMRPIYWSPVNDLATVTRATWFYRDTMLPVPTDVANQLEAGYQDLRPWTETWRDEVKCAIYVGSSAEEKLAYDLWPKGNGPKTVNKALEGLPVILKDPFCAARCFRGDAAAEGAIESAAGLGKGETNIRIPFLNYQVLYKNDKEAFMLKPGLKPSAYYGRKPLAKIVKGISIGIPVVRGFDRVKWDRIHVKKQGHGVTEPTGEICARESDNDGDDDRNETHDGDDDQNETHDKCQACESDHERGRVMDLILVAHGIGQKFAERVESFHFTHAINGFRRAVNIELKNPAIQQFLKKDQSRLMVLPVNWRMGLSFEDGGPMREEDMREHATDGFGLKDIEPKTIPAVRSIISDVMFDIPFYMSHHKGKMIKALVSEANRVYRLWCQNNPGFAENGRVHLIGHSLGSAMALEILSRQPTVVPPLDLSTEMSTLHFEFDTKNLFLAGSPAGFFLLLERRGLLPRRGRRKPGVDIADIEDKDIVGEVGTFGCLAVDNVYNVLAREDPIAYLLNGSVDADYAASLKLAHLPSTATPFFKSLGNSIRSIVPGMASSQQRQSSSSPSSDPSSTTTPTPDDDLRPRVPARLPSQLELEVHDFSREEIAEKKVYLLNDNGQIDWFLRSGGGPLEIQYLNMLGAHSSYWYSGDFIRMLCVEIGREAGRRGTLPGMRAVKKGVVV